MPSPRETGTARPAAPVTLETPPPRGRNQRARWTAVRNGLPAPRYSYGGTGHDELDLPEFQGRDRCGCPDVTCPYKNQGNRHAR